MPHLTFHLTFFETHLKYQARCRSRSQFEQKSNHGDARANLSHAVRVDSGVYHILRKYECTTRAVWPVGHFSHVFAVSLIFPRPSASYRWVAHLFALLALPVVALHSRCVLPPSVSYCQVFPHHVSEKTYFSTHDVQIFLMFVSYLDARMNSSFMRFLHRALCICAMLYLMLRRIIGT